MKKSLLFPLFCLIMTIICLSPNRLQAQTVWDGTADITWFDNTQTSFDISTAEELAGLAQLVNNSTNDFYGKTINLTADIWLNADGDSTNNWTPIGGGYHADGETNGNPQYFKGDFNGNGHTIYNLYCDNGIYFQAGLFGACGGDLTIQKLALANPVVKGAGMLGAITGWIENNQGNAEIKNCMVMNARIIGGSGNNIGCLVGANYRSNYTLIQSCGATGVVNGKYAGGLGGNSDHETFTNCYFAGTVIETVYGHLGGIAAYNGTLNNCYSNISPIGDGSSGTIKTTDYMQTEAFIADLDTTFKMDCMLNGGFPIQTWQKCGVFISGNLNICNGESTVLTASESSTYTWSTGETTQSITVSPTITTDYSVTATNDLGVETADTVTVIVYPQAIVTATAMPGEDNIVHGTVTPEESYVDCGSSDAIELTIIPDEGYHISKIVMNDIVLREDDPNDGDVVTYSIIPVGTLCTIQVYFSNVYTITTTLSDNVTNSTGFVSPWGDDGVYEAISGEDVEYHFHGNARYHISDVIIDDVSQGIINTYTFEDISQSHTINITYLDSCGIINIPFVEDFNNYPGNYMPDCWSRLGADGTSSCISTYYGDPCFCFYPRTVNYLIAPAIDTYTYPINTLQVSYSILVTNTDANFEIGVMTDPAHDSTFTTLYTRSFSQANVWLECTDYLQDYTGEGQYIAFRWMGNNNCWTYCNLDNIEISETPDCSPVRDLTVTDVTYDLGTGGSATVSWTPGAIGTPLYYTLEYKGAHDLDWTTIYDVMDTFYLLDGLNSSTRYTIRVNSDCGTSDMSEWQYAYCTIGCDSTEMCQYAFELSSSSSDPYSNWNGIALEVYQNGTLMQTLTRVTQTVEVHTLYICEGSDIEIKFKKPSWTSYLPYITFSISDPYGIEMFHCNAGDAVDWQDNQVIYTGIWSCTPPSCYRPETVTVTEHVHSADVYWTDDGDNSQSWIIEYGNHGFAPGTGTTDMAYSSPYTIMDLDSNVCYDVYVRTYCGDGDTSVRTRAVSFTTPLCELEDQCEYTFLLHDSYGDGWNGNKIEIYANDALLKVITLDNGYDNSIPVSLCNGAEVSLKWITGNYSDENSFYLTNFYYGDTIYTCTNGSTLSNGTTFHTFTVDCSYPECVRPTDISVANVTETSAELSWMEMGDASSWLIEYGTTGFVPGTGNFVVAYEYPLLIDGLNSNTFYDVYIQSLCNSGDTSIRTDVFTFSTACGDITTLPYYENFDGNNIVDEFLTCWVRHTSNPDHFVYVNSSAGQAHSEPGTLDFHYTPECFVMAAMQPFAPNIPINNLTVRFLSRTGNKDVGLREIGVMTDPYDTTTFESVAVIQLDNNNVWQEFEFIMNEYTGTGRYIAFRYSNAGSTQFLIDDLSIDYTPSCIVPNNVSVTNIDANNAEVHWTEKGDATAWEVQYYPENDMSNSAVLQASDTFLTITGLTENTKYMVNVRAVCDVDDSSMWSEIIAFRTACTATAIPYSCDFETVSTETGFIDCWTKGSGFYPHVDNQEGFNGTHSLHCSISIYSQDVAYYTSLPFVDETINPVNTLQMSLYARKAYASTMDQGVIIVGVMTNPFDENTFVAVDTIDCSSTDYEEYLISFDNYQGNGTYVSLKFPTPTNGCYYNECYIDDIFLETIPTCPRPVLLHGTNATVNSITLEWTERGDATEWEIAYGTPGFNIESEGTTIAASTNPFTITGLTDNTTYEFYVRALCSSYDISTWSASCTYSTFCLPIDEFPYTEGFENNGQMPNCWSQEYVENTLDWQFASGCDNIYCDYNQAHGGTYNALLKISDHIVSITKLVSPIFDLTNVENPYVSFWHMQPQWSNDLDKLKVYYRSNSTEEWTQLADYTNNIGVWTLDSMALPNPSATYQIAFEGTANYGYGVLVDDITVGAANDTPIETCDAPTGLNATTTTTTATVSWNETGVFEISYKTTTSTDWSANISVNNNTYTLTNLTPNTDYTWRVRQICGATTSDWATSTFQTEEESVEECQMPTNVTVSDITGNSAILTWDQEGEVENWTLNYHKTGETWTTATVETKPYTITDLESNSTYEAQVRANCGAGNSSEYTNIVTFTTTGIEDYALNNCFTLYPNPTTNYIDVKFNDNIKASEVLVYDVYGKLLQTIKVTENPVRIDVSRLAQGVYFVKAITENGMANRSFIKE